MSETPEPTEEEQAVAFAAYAAEFPEIVEMMQRVAAFRRQNAKMVNDIEAMGGAVDITTPRIEHTLGMLKSFGILTDEQFWTISVDWETSLRTQLRELRQKLTDVRMREASRNRLAVPGITDPRGPRKRNVREG